MKWIFPKPAFRREFDKIRRLRTVYRSEGGDVQVYDINPGEKKYVLKRVMLRRQDNNDEKLIQFVREIENGTRPGLRKGSHVRVHGYFFSPDMTSAMYVMDHASFGDPEIKETLTARRYMDSAFYDAKAFQSKLNNALDRFYRTFRGFHGDLHGLNVVVNLTAQNTIKSVVIIDYANIQPFLETDKKKYSARNVNRAFEAIYSENFNNFPYGSGIQVKWSGRSTRIPENVVLSNELNNNNRYVESEVPVRSNADMLRKLNNWSKLKQRV